MAAPAPANINKTNELVISLMNRTRQNSFAVRFFSLACKSNNSSCGSTIKYLIQV